MSASDQYDPSAADTVPGFSAEIAGLTALELRDALASGRITASAAVGHSLAVTGRLNPALGAFYQLAPELARERALQLDEHFAASGPAGPLHGMPLAFKDLLDVTGLRTTLGSAVAADAAPAEQDSELAATVHSAGAVSVGKTAVPEFGLPCHTESPAFPPARNPLDVMRTPGGSSGGAAAAVASGMLPFAPGNDGGGSVRIPAAACGLVGVKPGRSVVPADRRAAAVMFDGDEETAAVSVRNLTCSGPLARTAVDAGLLLDAMMGNGDGMFLRAAQQADPGTLSVGIITASPFAPDLEISLAPAALHAVTAAASALGSAGHQVGELPVQYRPDYHALFRTVWTSALQRVPLTPEEQQQVGPLSAYFLELTCGYSGEQVENAVSGLEEWAQDARRQLGEVDVVLTPMLAFAPPLIGAFTSLPPAQDYELQCRFTPYTSMVNVMGLPAVSVPVQRDRDGFSWSVQLIGRAGSEAQLVALAAQVEGLVRSADAQTGDQ